MYNPLCTYFQGNSIYMTSFQSWWQYEKLSPILWMIITISWKRSFIRCMKDVLYLKDICKKKANKMNAFFKRCLFIYFCLRHLLSRRLVALPVNCISYFLVHAVWQILEFCLNFPLFNSLYYIRREIHQNIKSDNMFLQIQSRTFS